MNTKNRFGGYHSGEGGRGGKMGKGSQKVQTSVTDYISIGDTMYSMATVVKNIVLHILKLPKE